MINGGKSLLVRVSVNAERLHRTQARRRRTSRILYKISRSEFLKLQYQNNLNTDYELTNEDK